MTIIVDAHQHFWNYGTYQSSWMEAPPYAGDPGTSAPTPRFLSFAIAAMMSGRGPGEDRVRPRCVPQPLAVCAALGLFAAYG
jgi:hypothetical protein